MRPTQSHVYALVLLIGVIVRTKAQVPKLSRRLGKHGFHRDLETVLALPGSVLPDIGEDVECFLLFTEIITSGVYVDPYQLNSLRHHGGPDAVVVGTVDVEKPEFTASQFTVYVYTNISVQGDTLYGSYTLPVHLRYHKVSHNSDYATVTFRQPEVAVRCINKALGMTHYGYHGETKKQKSEKCNSNSRILCDWLVIQYQAETVELGVSVPVGREEHYLLVTIATVLTTLGGCLLLVYKTVTVKTKSKIS